MKNTHSFDIVIIGAGGAGLRAAIAACAAGASVAVVSKVPPARSHTVAAQGGINAALGNVTPDDWRWHMFDTVRGSDWLGDQDSIAFMCKQAPAAIHELEAMGVDFTRDQQGNIYQRPYGGMSTDFGKGGMAYRACAAADQIGNAMMDGLTREMQKYDAKFFVEFIVLDLLFTKDGAACGVLAWELATGEIHQILGREIIIATGGYGQVYAATTAASTCTGDGNAFALRAGLGLQDMEYVQFHPTGIYGYGILISEAARAEGGVLLNNIGERFMERYAPKYKDLASRDVVARAMFQEIREGRGCGAKGDHLLLDMSQLDEKTIAEGLPTIKTIAQQFGGTDISKTPVPVVPTAHYTMGGIPTNRECQVLFVAEDGSERIVEGLYAIGEAASNSVHGANRLGCNSLLDLVVFGKYAGEKTAELARGQAAYSAADIAPESLEKARQHFMRLSKGGKADGVTPFALRKNIQEIMMQHGGILRDFASLQAGIKKLLLAQEVLQSGLAITDQTRQWNNQLVTAIEAENLLLQALATLTSANYRTESRGAHFREDYPLRDDENWQVHSLVSIADGGAVRLQKRAVRMDTGMQDVGTIAPQLRSY